MLLSLLLAFSIAAPADTAIFAGGCFWSMERPFDHTPGVINATVGYTGGRTVNPTYEEVSTKKTGHAEAVRVIYDPALVSYPRLLDIYWHNIDPLTTNAQFCDGGTEYRSAIFYTTGAQRTAALASLPQIQAHFKEKVVTQIVPAAAFYPAEAYHQHFAERSALHYHLYRLGCGRDARLRTLWGAAAAPNVPATP